MGNRDCLYRQIVKIQKVFVVLLLLIMVVITQGVPVNAKNQIIGINKDDTILPIRYNSVSASKKIQLNKKKLSLLLYSTYQLKIKNKKTTTKVKWYSADKKIAKVSEKGVVTAKKVGTTKISAKISNKRFVCKVTVKQPNTSNKVARKKFKQYLSQSKIPWGTGIYSKYEMNNFKFICLDMGKNKVPVMILFNSAGNHGGGYIGIYQYVKGKVREVVRKEYIQEIRPEIGMISVGYFQGGRIYTWYYSINNMKTIGKETAYTFWMSEDEREAARPIYPNIADNEYKIGKKNVTKKKFDSYYKKLIKNSSKVKDVDKWLLDNTEFNREKYFK